MPSPKNKPRVLMIAFHFPPLAGSSGIQRTLRFVQHLPAMGWEPVVLSIDPSAYENTRQDLLDEIPDGTPIKRAYGLDVAKKLSIAGRYPAFLATPDRWATWWPAAVWSGLRLIKQYKPDVIWSTYPIATAHKIGATLHRLTGLPWIADFRDPMVQDGYPADPAKWKSFKRIEEAAIREAHYSVFTTPSSMHTYQTRYPEHADKIVMIENGYDETSFSDIKPAIPHNPGTITLLHSGIIYPEERDPTQFFRALRLLLDDGRIRAGQLRIRFRAPVAVSLLETLMERFAVSDMIEILPQTGYREALQEMLSSDALLIFQASNCNEQIPAKLYEYLRAKRPVLALTDPTGDTAKVLQQAGIQTIAPLDDAVEIANLIFNFLTKPGECSSLAKDEAIASASRANRTSQLAGLLELTIRKT